MSFSIITVTCIALSFIILMMKAESTELTADNLEQVVKSAGVPLVFLTPTDSPYDNTNLNFKDGPVSFFASLFHSFDDYVANPLLLNPTYKILTSGVLGQLPVISFAGGVIVFINETDYKFIHAGLENNVINCLQDLHL